MDELLHRHKTLLLDMDGTLLDLAYDTCFWLETLPTAFAEARGLSPQSASEQVMALIESERGTLNWYCLDFWSDTLQLDVLALKSQCREPIRYLDGAEDFLQRARRFGHELIIVTNSSPDLLTLKDQATGIKAQVDATYSSGEFGVPKESQEFWQQFTEQSGIKREECILLDDSALVLQAAETFGLGAVLGITHPDSGRPPNALADWPTVAGVRELLLA